MSLWRSVLFPLAVAAVLTAGARGEEPTYKVEWETCAGVDGFVPPAMVDGSVCYVVDCLTFQQKVVVRVAGGLGLKGDVGVFGAKAHTLLVLTGEFPIGTSKKEAVRQLELELANRLAEEKFREEARAAAEFEAKLESFAPTTIRYDRATSEELLKILAKNASPVAAPKAMKPETSKISPAFPTAPPDRRQPRPAPPVRVSRPARIAHPAAPNVPFRRPPSLPRIPQKSPWRPGVEPGDTDDDDTTAKPGDTDDPDDPVVTPGDPDDPDDPVVTPGDPDDPYVTPPGDVPDDPDGGVVAPDDRSVMEGGEGEPDPEPWIEPDSEPDPGTNHSEPWSIPEPEPWIIPEPEEWIEPYPEPWVDIDPGEWIDIDPGEWIDIDPGEWIDTDPEPWIEADDPYEYGFAPLDPIGVVDTADSGWDAQP